MSTLVDRSPQRKDELPAAVPIERTGRKRPAYRPKRMPTGQVHRREPFAKNGDKTSLALPQRMPKGKGGARRMSLEGPYSAVTSQNGALLVEARNRSALKGRIHSELLNCFHEEPGSRGGSRAVAGVGF